MSVRSAFQCRAYPDEAQRVMLARTFGCVRVVWNRTLAARHARWHAEGKGTSYAETDRALTAMKKHPGLAFLRLAKTGSPLRFVWTWPGVDVTALDPAMVIICREPDGRWYVTFTVDAAAPEPLPPAGRAVGVDLGVKDFAVTSDGERITNPRHLDRRARNLARYQRRLARCRKGSANRAKAAAKVARAHRKVRNRRLARAISDCGWGEFRRQLEYKCQRAGRELVVLDRWYPSSKTCSACGHLLAELSLGTRRWACPSCGARHDRDLNAAKNILAAGLAVARGSPGDACGADVRHSGSSRVQSAVKQEPRPARAGIPVLQGGE